MCIEKIESCTPTFAPCVRYELPLLPISKITNKCVDLEDTTKDLYEIATEIKALIPANLIATIQTMQSQIATLQTQVTALQVQNICLKSVSQCVNITGQDPCGSPITNLGQVLNYLINKVNT